MNIMVDSRLLEAAASIVSSTHRLIQFDISDMEYMPYDVEDTSIVADWLYTLSVDHDADMIIVNSANLRDELMGLGIETMRIG